MDTLLDLLLDSLLDSFGPSPGLSLRARSRRAYQAAGGAFLTLSEAYQEGIHDSLCVASLTTIKAIAQILKTKNKNKKGALPHFSLRQIQGWTNLAQVS